VVVCRHEAQAGPTPTALWISARGLATGYHVTDKVTSDGVLCGFEESDFEPSAKPLIRRQLTKP
jgi:hypothetical protein